MPTSLGTRILYSSRRTFLYGLALGAGAWAAPGAFAEALQLTPRQTAGPFYPDRLPLDTDNDLLILNDSATPAVGTVTHLSGRVLDSSGAPVRNALVEIWQVDNNGVYLHSASPARDKRDAHFQGYGRFMTGSSGEYYFRTIKPVPYSQGSFRRTPHIHFAVQVKGRERFTTQCYIRGEPLNSQDGVLNGISDARARDAVQVDFTPLPESSIGELAARFDMVLGLTPDL